MEHCGCRHAWDSWRSYVSAHPTIIRNFFKPRPHLPYKTNHITKRNHERPHGRMSELAALICSSAWAASLSMAARHNWKRHQSSQAEWGVPWRLCSPTQVAGKNTSATRRTLSNREEGERDTDKIKEHESSDEIRVGRPRLPLAHPRTPQSTYLSDTLSTATGPDERRLTFLAKSLQILICICKALTWLKLYW